MNVIQHFASDRVVLLGVPQVRESVKIARLSDDRETLVTTVRIKDEQAAMLDVAERSAEILKQASACLEEKVTEVERRQNIGRLCGCAANVTLDPLHALALIGGQRGAVATLAPRHRLGAQVNSIRAIVGAVLHPRATCKARAAEVFAQHGGHAAVALAERALHECNLR